MGFAAGTQATLKKFFSSNLQKNLYIASNGIMSRAVDMSGALRDNKTVQISQDAQRPTAVWNRATLPATIGSQSYGTLEFSGEDVTTDPITIRNITAKRTAFNVASNVIYNIENVIKESILEKFLYNIVAQYGVALRGDNIPTSQISRTTGAAGTGNTPGGLANAKTATLDDIHTIAVNMDLLNIPMTNRQLVINPITAKELVDDARSNTQYIINNPTTLNIGQAIEALFGFRVTVINTGLFANASLVPQDVYSTAPVATSLAISIAYHPDFVCQGLGDMDLSIDPDRVEYFGGIYAGEAVFGANRMRKNALGVHMLIQEN